MRSRRGFTMVEMVIATAMFAAGSLYIYSTFTGVTRSTQNATVAIDLGSQNKKALTKVYNELQATSVIEQDTDGVDSTPPEAVFSITEDTGAPRPFTAARLVERGTFSASQTGETVTVGGNKVQAREMVVATQTRLRFRKVIGYQFNAGAGSILPEWSNWVTYRVDSQRRLIREVPGRPTRTVANRVDVFNAREQSDGTIVVSLVTGRRNPDGRSVKRYANAVTIHPKN
ncbi:MAG: PulJ/GspJ family protein [Planctomycetota bacterium]|jgi:prepilin-type N-terminal cleavage/methylation domain-containing protein